MLKSFPARLAIAAAFLVVTFTTAALTQTANEPAPATPQPAAAPFAPGFDDLMTMLVQPRHIRLYYAGSAKNWELAAAEARDLRSSFDRIAKTIPNYEGNDVALSVQDFIAPKIDAMDVAIAAGNPEKFAAAYQDLTNGCNACHTYMEHPFLVIKKPAEGMDAVHPDQEFSPSPP